MSPAPRKKLEPLDVDLESVSPCDAVSDAECDKRPRCTMPDGSRCPSFPKVLPWGHG